MYQADGELTEAWLRPEHAESCDTSCNLCLRDFYNLSFHGLLDWRLGLDMARIAADAAAPIDLCSPWQGRTNPWSILCEGADSPVVQTLARLRFEAPLSVAGLSVFQQKRRTLALVLRHPLWTDGHPQYEQAVTVIRSTFPGHDIRPINPFRLLRRPADALG